VAFDNNDKKNITYYKNKINNSSLKKYSNFYNINKSKTLEYPMNIETYINSISKIIKNNNGIFLMFDYGYSSVLGKNTIKAIRKHKTVDLLKEYTDCDITFDINFNISKYWNCIPKFFFTKIRDYGKSRSNNQKARCFK
jgi:SAM-dependent MidA family methyltransferase